MNWKLTACLLGGVVSILGALAVAKPSLLAWAATENVSIHSKKTPVHQMDSARMPVLLAQVQPITTTTTTTTYGGWTVTCSQAGDPPAKTCSAQFRVVSKENKAIVLIWLLGRDREGKLLAEFVTPSDILIRPGVAVTLDDAKPLKAEYLSCTAQQGCRASMELTAKTMRDLAASAKATIGITLLNGNVMDVGFEIPGIDLVLADLEAGL